MHSVDSLLPLQIMSLAILACSTQGKEPSSRVPFKDDAVERARSLEFLEGAKAAAAEYEFFIEQDRKQKLILRPEPILRWSNREVGTVLGAVFIWTGDGRPEVVASIFNWYDNPARPVQHELHSLALGRLTVLRAGQEVWRPAKAGVEFKPIPAGPAPAGSAPQRLHQMRSLAREFSASYDEPDDQTELRLLTQPIYRYESTRPDLIDGAMFAFVQDTDPEVLLLVEARRKNGGSEWQYAFARMQNRALQAHHKERPVWEVPDCWAQVTDRQAVYTSFFPKK